MKRPGPSVSHRTEYSVAAPKPSSAGSVQMLASEAIAKGLSGGPLHLHLKTLPYRDDKGNASVHAVLQVDGVALTEAAQGKAMAVQIYGYAMSGGRVLDGIALNTSIDLVKFGAAVGAPGSICSRLFRSRAMLWTCVSSFAPGPRRATGSIQRSVALPAFAPGERVLSTPMFLLPRTDGHLVVPFQPQSRPQIKVPFYIGDERFVPDATVTLSPGQARDLCVFVWRDRKSSTPPLTVTGDLVRAGETAQPIRIEGAPRVVPDTDGFDRYRVTLVPPDLPSGDYRLRLTFADGGTGRASRTETDVVIVK